MDFYAVLLPLLCTSCNDKVKITGIVVDKSSKKPLDNVAITNLDELGTKGFNAVPGFTLADGKFILFYPSKGIKEKSRLPFIFQKRGYGSITEFYPREAKNDTIYLERLSD
jgi:hypothetical protein